jgi:hypothetical protein
MRRPLALALDQVRQGEHDRDADNEQKQRKKEVVEVDALPCHVLELIADILDDRARQAVLSSGHVMQCPGESVSRDDPEHRETAQGVHRGHAAWRRFRRGRDGHQAVGAGRRSVFRALVVGGARVARCVPPQSPLAYVTRQIRHRGAVQPSNACGAERQSAVLASDGQRLN